jgi:hypothetical protein
VFATLQALITQLTATMEFGKIAHSHTDKNSGGTTQNKPARY